MSLAKLFKNGDEDSIKAVITSAEFDVLQIDGKTGESVYHLLAKHDFSQALKAFIQKVNTLDPDNRPNIDGKDKEGQTPLVTALAQGADECCYALINGGADVNATFEKHSILMLSAQVKKPRLSEILLAKGADPNYTNSTGSAMHYAIEQENEYLFESLLGTPSLDLSLVNNKKQNVLHLTIGRNAVWALPQLLQKLEERRLKEVYTAKDEQGYCPVHLAACALRENIVGLVSKSGVAVGVEGELLDGTGKSCRQLMEEVEDANREQKRQAEREKEALKAKKAQERAEQKEREAEERKSLEQVKEIQHLEKVKAEVLAEEEEKRRPLKLLLVFAVVILLLYVLLKIGVATGATKRAAAKEDHPEL